MPIHCGLCNRGIDDWEKHIKSEEHIANLHNKEALSKAFEDSQGDLLKELHGEGVQGLAPPLVKKKVKK